MKHILFSLALMSCIGYNSYAQHPAMSAGNVSNASAGYAAAGFHNQSNSSFSASQPAQLSAPRSTVAGTAATTGSNTNTAYSPAGSTFINSSPGAAPVPGGDLRTGHTGSYTVSNSQRYSCFNNRSYSYSSSRYTREKSRRHRSDHVHLFHHWCRFPLFYDVYVPVPDIVWVACDDDDILNNGTLPRGASAVNASFDGYMVYGQDTLSGVVTLTPDKVLVEQQADNNKEKGYRTTLQNTKLKAVVLFDGNEELHLARITPGDKKLSRVLHTGKLNVYDDRYNFPTAGNVNKTRMTVSCNGHVETQQSYLTVDAKRLLIESINQAYGFQLRAQDFTWKSLLEYLDKLD